MSDTPPAMSVLALLLAAPLASCTPAATPAPVTVASQSILASSSPANGALLSRAPTALELRFSPPARLGEVTITGSDGSVQPMMVSAVGEVRDYSLPLDLPGKGRYTVAWRATAQGSEHRGTFAFEVR